MKRDWTQEINTRVTHWGVTNSREIESMVCLDLPPRILWWAPAVRHRRCFGGQPPPSCQLPIRPPTAPCRIPRARSREQWSPCLRAPRSAEVSTASKTYTNPRPCNNKHELLHQFQIWNVPFPVFQVEWYCIQSKYKNLLNPSIITEKIAVCIKQNFR